ncbi:ANKL1 protein, partial [Alcedo cyanopectus]|nr:ANKL1 protein [Ceyx cyanopectus]
PAEELTPLHVAAVRGCCRCLQLLRGKRGDPQHRAQVSPCGVPLAGVGVRGLIQTPPVCIRHRLPPLSPELRGARCFFLPEDGTDGIGSGPLSSTRRSLLEELESGCSLGDPVPCRGCPPPLSTPFFASCPHADPRGSALPPHPLASSTLLSDGDELLEGPQSRMVAKGPPRANHEHPQDCPSGAQGSPGSSPTVLLVPGDHGHPQDSPLAAGSPSARVPEGSLVRQDPSSLGTHQPHGSFSGLLAPWPPSRTVAEPRRSAVPVSPAACNAHRSGEHLEDAEQGEAPAEQQRPGTETITNPTDATIQDRQVCPVPPQPLSDDALRQQLRALGDDPGPITELTRRFPELAAALQSGHVPDCAQDELELVQQFDHPNPSRHWREGLVKSSFNYLLLDPRTTQNLPLRSHHLSPAECFRTFVKGIFYVGKGTRARPYCHLTEALSQHRAGTQRGCPKVQRILEIWASGQGVVSVHCFQSSVPAEAYTREGCLVEALG